MKRWPLFLIAAPAAVAVWSGWVGLGQLCGFGLVQPLPGIAPWRVDTAITLPVGVEAYASYALGAWLTPGTPDRARTFARRSAIGALALGMTGQVVYHLLAAAHAAKAPWPVVVLVACLPVVTLGFGVALAHLLRVPDEERHTTRGPQQQGPQMQPQPYPQPVPDAPSPASITAAGMHSASASGSQRQMQSRPGRNRTRETVTDADAEMHFGAGLAAGQVPSARRIQRELHVGQTRAAALRERLQSVATSQVREQ